MDSQKSDELVDYFEEEYVNQEVIQYQRDPIPPIPFVSFESLRLEIEKEFNTDLSLFEDDHFNFVNNLGLEENPKITLCSLESLYNDQIDNLIFPPLMAEKLTLLNPDFKWPESVTPTIEEESKSQTMGKEKNLRPKVKTKSKSPKCIYSTKKTKIKFVCVLFGPRRIISPFEIEKVYNNETQSYELIEFGSYPPYKMKMRISTSNLTDHQNKRELYSELDKMKLFIRPYKGGECYLENERIRWDKLVNFKEKYIDYNFAIPSFVSSRKKRDGLNHVKFVFVVKMKGREIFQSEEFLVYNKVKPKKDRITPFLTSKHVKQFFNDAKELDYSKMGFKYFYYQDFDEKITDMKFFKSVLRVNIKKYSFKSTKRSRYAVVKALGVYIKDNFDTYKYIYSTKKSLMVRFTKDGRIKLHFSCTNKGRLENRINSFKKQVNFVVETFSKVDKGREKPIYRYRY